MSMSVDINTLRTIGTVFVFVAFIGICIWAYSAKRKKSFDEAADLPFADDDNTKTEDNHASANDKPPEKGQ